MRYFTLHYGFDSSCIMNCFINEIIYCSRNELQCIAFVVKCGLRNYDVQKASAGFFRLITGHILSS